MDEVPNRRNGVVARASVSQSVDLGFNLLVFSSSYGRVSMIQVRHNKKMGTEGLFFYHLNLLCYLDQMLAVIELSQHLVSSSKTVRPIIPRGARCVGYVKIMWSAVCSLAPHSHFAEGARPPICAWTNQNAQRQYAGN